MSGTAAGRLGAKSRNAGAAVSDGPWVRRCLMGTAIGFLGLFVVAPLVVVFAAAFGGGLGSYFAALWDDMTLSAIRLTLLAACVAVPMNLVFGIGAAWLLSKYEFWGKGALVTLIDLPFSVSPVVAGLIFVLLFGRSGWFGPLLLDSGIRIIFAVPGIVLATTFVTFPIVARELLAVMQAQGSEEEHAAMTLGASGWQILYRITLPKVKWGILYGVILSNARAMGEFGAVSVVSGHVRGATNTMPLHIEILYGEYNTQAAFAVASLLVLLALLTLVLKKWVEWKAHHQEAGPEDHRGHAAPELATEGARA